MSEIKTENPEQDNSTPKETQNTSKSSSDVPEAKFEFWKYIPMMLFIWIGSWYPSTLILSFYYKYLIQPDIGLYSNLITVITNQKLLLITIFTPLLLVLLYILRLIMVAVITKILIGYCNWRSPMVELISARGIGKKEAKQVNYYHMRGAVLRIAKWVFGKSLFPWFLPWAFNFAGVNNIGKGTVLEDQYYTQEFLETGKNAYIGQGSIVSSHLVEGKYGAITLKKVTLGENAVLGAFEGVPPGCCVEDNAELVTMSAIPKFQRLRANSKYWGLPASRMGYKRYCKSMQLDGEFRDKVLALKKKSKKEKDD